MHHLSGCFPGFFFVFSFQKFNYDILIWISLLYPIWGFAQPLQSVDFHLSPYLESYQSLFLTFQICFLSCHWHNTNLALL
jgi:hypothetical protein